MKIFCAFAFVWITAVFSAGQLHAQSVAGPGGNYWPLYCKTGSVTKVEVDTMGRLRLFLESSGAPAKSDFSGLTPGKCSWPDRAMRKDELQGYYGEIFAQWECPAAVPYCFGPVYDSSKHIYVPPFPFFRDPAGKKFKIWLRKEDKHMQILGETVYSIKYEMVP